MHKFDTISSKSILKNPYWEYKVNQYVMPNDEIGEYHFVNSNGSTFIIPRLNETTFVLIRQYRYLNNRFSIEFPGGGIERNFDKIGNARKELKEETGYIANSLIEIGEFNPYHGVTNEICSLFLADGLEVSNTDFDTSEEIENIELTYDEINDKIKNGEIWDGMSLAAWTIFIFSKYIRRVV